MPIRSRGGRRSTRRVLPGGRRAPMSRSARYSRVARVPRGVSRPLATAVKRIVDSRLETKFVTYAVENNVLHNSAMGVADWYRIIPQIPSGTGDNQRAGDRVAPSSLYVRGMIARADPALNNKAIMVRVLALQLKGEHYFQTSQSAWAGGAYSSLLKYNSETTTGAAEVQPFNGTQQDLYQPVNRDVYDVLGERFIKLDGHIPGSVESAPVSSLAKNFNMKIRTPKVLRYGNSGNQLPENFAPFLTIGYAYMDGTAPDIVATQVVANAFAHLYYKDA